MTDDARSRRLSGAVLLGGALLLAAVVEGGVLPYSSFPLLTGVVLLAAAAAGRRRTALWAPGLVLLCVGATVVAWFEAGRPLDFQFTALVVLSCGLGGVLAALLDRLTPVVVTPMSVSLAVLGFGAFALAEQQRVGPFASDVRLYALLLALWGAVELRPARDGSPSVGGR
ncbi:MAG TPA: hypothetical protein VNU66_09865 [Mycobacteriales bacterium]|nr:hypothetical protein [Mycobacteriales bacterium]